MEPCETICKPVDQKLDGVYSEIKKKVPIWVLAPLVVIFAGIVGYGFARGGAIEKSAAEISTAVQVQSKQYEYLGKELSRFGADFEKRKESVDREIGDLKRR